MQKAQIIRWKYVKELRDSVDDNVRLYRDGGFDGKISADKTMEDTSVEIDADALSSLNSATPTATIRVENALLIWNSLKGMHPYLARDERFWAYLTHSHCRDYTWKSGFPPGTEGLGTDASKEEKEALVKRIRTRFFIRNNHDLVRDNVLSRLWWWAYIANRYDGANLRKTLEVLLTTTSVRDAVINRPSLTRGVNGFSAVMDVLIERHDKDPQAPLFKKIRCDAWLKEINRHGGVLLLESMPRDELKGLFEELAVQAEQG